MADFGIKIGQKSTVILGKFWFGKLNQNVAFSTAATVIMLKQVLKV